MTLDDEYSEAAARQSQARAAQQRQREQEQRARRSHPLSQPELAAEVARWREELGKGKQKPRKKVRQ